MSPRSASKPPQKLSGAASRNGSPRALPLSTVRPANNSSIEHHLALHRGPYAFSQAAERETHANIGRRVVRHLSRIGHHHALELLDDRRDVGAGVGDDPDAARLQALQAAVLFELPQHEAAGVDIER